MKKCTNCKKSLENSQFWSSVNTKSGLSSWCKICSRNYQLNQYKTLNWQIKHRVRAAKARAKRFNVAFNIDVAYMQKLWEKQKGCCALSKLPLLLDDGSSGKQPFRPSIDRIDPNKGYVKGNVRIVATIVNFAINKWGFDNFLIMCNAITTNEENNGK